MSIEIYVPTLPESVVDATLITWHKQVGDVVQKDDNLVDLETDKVVLEVPAPESGVLTEILVEDGSTVTSGDLLAKINTETAAVTKEPAKKESVAADIPLSPAVRRIIFEHSLDPSQITGTGKGGRITKSDVQDYLAQNSAASLSPTTAEAKTKPVPIAEPTPKKESTTSNGSSVMSSNGVRSEQRVPMTRLRAKVAERLLQAQQNAAILTTFNEVNMQSVIDLRKQYQERFTAKHGVLICIS
jgi:2-oxoglutarate dehydrogenase E2 component (dihydrolipoamide succinyltransferase)